MLVGGREISKCYGIWECMGSRSSSEVPKSHLKVMDAHSFLWTIFRTCFKTETNDPEYYVLCSAFLMVVLSYLQLIQLQSLNLS